MKEITNIKEGDVVRIKANGKLMKVAKINENGFVNGTTFDKHHKKHWEYIKMDKIEEVDLDDENGGK